MAGFTSPFSDAVEQQLLRQRDAAAAAAGNAANLDRGQTARSILDDPLIHAWFKRKALETFATFLAAPSGSLDELRVQMLGIFELHKSLCDAVELGDVSARRLAEQAKRDATDKPKE